MQKRLLGILVSIAVVVAACDSATISASPLATTEPGTSGEASAPALSNLADEQILRVVLPVEPGTLDPTLAGGAVELSVLGSLHRGLVSLDQDLDVVPELAESWDIADDARTLTFHLRDATYSNGDPIIAGDFVYSWKRLADPRTAAAYSYVMAEVEGGPELLGMAGADLPSDADIEAALDNLGVEAPDDKTFIVHLNMPATYFLSAMTLWVFGPVQEKWITSEEATEAANYVSSGPFILDTWEHDSQIVLKPNPNWLGDVKPTLTEIRMSILADPAAAQAAYEADEIDIVQTPSQDIQRIKNDPVLAAEYREASQLTVNFYAYNNFQHPNVESYARPGPTANKDFRIALTQAIDKQALIDTTYAGLGLVANSFIMPGIPGHQPDLNPYPYDLDSAIQHMDKALAELGVGSTADLDPLRFGYPSGGANAEAQVAFLTEAWRQAFGLEFEQVPTEVGVHFSELFAGEYAIAWSGWGADYPHANNQLTGTFTCGGANNTAQYCNAAFDALIARVAAEPDQDAQVAVYNEAQALLFDDAPILPIRFAVGSYEVKPYVSGLVVTPSDGRVPGDAHFETIQILEH
jgi:oligopeptide transport system substrate-binding protein